MMGMSRSAASRFRGVLCGDNVILFPHRGFENPAVTAKIYGRRFESNILAIPMATAVLRIPLLLVWMTYGMTVFAAAQVAANGESDLAQRLIERLMTPGDFEIDDQRFIPPSRESLRPLVTAARLIREAKPVAAAVVLGEFLADAEVSDFLIPLDPKTAVGARRAAHLLMESIPDAACDDYRLKFAVVAQQQLDQAIEDLDRRALARLSSRYFFTAAGRQATMLLGHLDFSQGRLGQAEHAFRRLVTDARRRKQFDPESWLMLATIHLVQGDEAAAERAVSELLRDRGLAVANPRDLEFLGEPLKLPDRADEGLVWLRQLVRSSALLSGRPVDEWRMTKGAANHNAVTRSGLPMRWAEWSVSLIDEDDAAGRSPTGMSGEPPPQFLPNFFPIAAGDQILARTQRGVSSFDLTTGALRWTYPPRLPAIRAAALSNGKVAGEEASAVRPSLGGSASEWDQSFFDELTSDGKSLFVTPYALRGAAKATANSFRPSGAFVAFDLAVQCLRAIDLRREGALRWQIGGLSGMDDAAYRGKTFLGAPLVLENRLYALAEHESMIELLVIDADSGKLIVTQRLAMASSEIPAEDYRDSSLGTAKPENLSPAYADGILVCPCRHGTLVGVLLDDLSLVWGYVPPKSQTTTIPPYDYPGRRSSNSNPPLRWSKTPHQTLIVEQGVVLSKSRHGLGWTILELFSGRELHGDAHRLHHRELASSSFVAGIREGKLLAVVRQGMHALSIPTMQPLWKLEFDASETVSGTGFFSEQHYHLPLSSGRVLQIDLRDGSIAREVRVNEPLGNLIRHRGVLISQTSTRLAMLLPEQASQTIESTIPPDDPKESKWLLRVKSHVLLEQGRFGEAAALLEEMQAQGPQSPPPSTLIDLYLKLVEQTPDWTSSGLQSIEQADSEIAARVLARRIRAWATAHPEKFADRLLEHLPRLAPEAWSLPISHRELKENGPGGGAVRFDHFVGCVLGQISTDLSGWPALRNRLAAAGVPGSALHRIERSAEAEWNRRFGKNSAPAANSAPTQHRDENRGIDPRHRLQSLDQSKFFRYVPRGLGDRSPPLPPVDRSSAWTYHMIVPNLDEPYRVTIREVLNAGLEFFDSKGLVLGRIKFQPTTRSATETARPSDDDEITVEDSNGATDADDLYFDSRGGVCLRRGPWHFLLTGRSARMIYCERNQWETARIVWSKPIAIDLDSFEADVERNPAEKGENYRRSIMEKAVMVDDANVILLDNGRLQALALETGEVNWELAVDNRARLISWARQVLVIEDEARSATVVDPGLGLTLEKVKLPEGRLCQLDRDILVIERQRGRQRTLAGYGPTRNFAEIWSRPVEQTFSCAGRSGTFPAILNANRTLEILDPWTGTTHVSIDLSQAAPANRTIHRLHVHEILDSYLIVLETRKPDLYLYLDSDSNDLQFFSIMSEFPLRTGYLWAVDATTGRPLWDAPLRFEAMTWFFDTDGHSPILAGGRKLSINSHNRSFSETRNHWHFFDLRKGCEIARVEGTARGFLTYRYLFDLSQGTVTFLPGASIFSFELSEEPPAPGPQSTASLRGSRLFRLPAFESNANSPETPPSRPKGLDRMREAREQEAKSRQEIIEVFERGGGQR